MVTQSSGPSFWVPDTQWAAEIVQLQQGTRRLRLRLTTLQDGACYWCHDPLKSGTTTREHVIRRASAAYQQLSPAERALAVRLVHRACNQRHNQWSARCPKPAHEQDERLARALQETRLEESSDLSARSIP